jgi:hypothetical protein
MTEPIDQEETDGGAQDKQLTCIRCQAPFTFAVGEQYFFRRTGLSDPRRCPRCRVLHRAFKEGMAANVVRPPEAAIQARPVPRGWREREPEEPGGNGNA